MQENDRNHALTDHSEIDIAAPDLEIAGLVPHVCRRVIEPRSLERVVHLPAGAIRIVRLSLSLSLPYSLLYISLSTLLHCSRDICPYRALSPSTLCSLASSSATLFVFFFFFFFFFFYFFFFYFFFFFLRSRLLSLSLRSLSPATRYRVIATGDEDEARGQQGGAVVRARERHVLQLRPGVG